MRTIVFLVAAMMASPVTAQRNSAPISQTDRRDQDLLDVQQAPTQPMASAPVRAGSVAQSSVGEVGQRLDRNQAIGIEPMARLESRIANRVQNRIRNRIDRTYDPQANAISPFATAEKRTRNGGRTGN